MNNLAILTLNKLDGLECEQIDHIVVIDNQYLSNTEEIGSRYHRILYDHTKAYPSNKVTIIKTHPDFKTTNLLDNINKIGLSDNSVNLNQKTHFNNLFNNIKQFFDNEYGMDNKLKKELVMFTSISTALDSDTIDTINSLKAYNVSMSLVLLNSYVYGSLNVDSFVTVYKYHGLADVLNFIDTTMFFLNGITDIKRVQIEIENGLFVGIGNSVMTNTYVKNHFLLSSLKSNILYNSYSIAPIKYSIANNQDGVIDAINNILDHIDTLDTQLDDDLYEQIKNIIKQIPYKNSRCSQCSKRLVDMLFRKVDTNLETIDPPPESNSGTSLKYLVEYAKKSKLTAKESRHEIKLYERSVNNLKMFEDVDKSVHKTKLTIDRFISEVGKGVVPIEPFDKSKEFYFSTISFSDWYEELVEDGAIGLLVKINTSDLVKIGINSYLDIVDVTTTFFPIVDYISRTVKFFEQQQLRDTFGNLNNQTIVSGDAIGDGNAVIPLYINRYHWLSAEKYFKPLMGTILTHNPLGYTENHKKIMFSILTDINTYMYSENKLSEKWIKCYIAFFRTCTQICFDEGYNRGIRKYVNLYLNSPSRRISHNLYNYDNIVGQSLTTGYTIDNKNMAILIRYFLEEILRKKTRKEFKDNYMDWIKTSECNFGEEKNNILEWVEKELAYHVRILLSFCKSNELLKKIVCKAGSFNKFINEIENNFGLLPDKYTDFIFDQIKTNIGLNNQNPTLKDLYDKIGILFNEQEMIFLCLQGIKHSKNSDRLKAIENGTYIDVTKLKEPITTNFIDAYVQTP